jgi:DNA-binding NarL/FixJ family response regulator
VKRVLLVEGHAVFRQALAINIDDQPGLRVVAQAGSIDEGLRMAAEGFDAAVVDLGLPAGDGPDLVAGLHQANPVAGILWLSRRRDLNRYAEALEAGAATMISRDTSLEELLGALKFLSSGEVFFLSRRV